MTSDPVKPHVQCDPPRDAEHRKVADDRAFIRSSSLNGTGDKRHVRKLLDVQEPFTDNGVHQEIAETNGFGMNRSDRKNFRGVVWKKQKSPFYVVKLADG